MSKKTCPICHKDFYKANGLSMKLWNRRIYCGKRCYGQAISGIKRSPEVGMKISTSRTGMKFSKQHIVNISKSLRGRTPWNKRLKGVQKAWNSGLPMKERSKRKMSGTNNYNWKGDEVGYFGIHRWITRKYGRADHCSFDSDHGGLFEWANISGTYKRDIGDWSQLCVKCHREYDNLLRHSQKRNSKGQFEGIEINYYGVGNAFA